MKTLIAIFSLISIVAKADIMSSQVTDRSDVPEVSVGSYVVGAVYQFPAIQTIGLATCVGVTLYDSTRRQGAIMHVSGMTDIPAALNQVLNEMINNGSLIQNIQVQLHGGWDRSMGDAGINFTSDIMVSTLLSELNARQIPVVLNQTLVTKEQMNQGAAININIELDLMTGAVYQYSQTEPYFGGDISRRMPESSHYSGI